MEFSGTLLAKILGFMVFLYLAAGLLAELEWKLRIRLVVAFTIGCVVIGMLPWKFVSPVDPVNPVSILTSDITPSAVLALIVFSSIAVIITYFACSPYSFEFACLVIPAGLALWTFRSGQMADYLQGFSQLEDRTAVYSTLRWEVLLWGGLIMLGVLLAGGIKKLTTGERLTGGKRDFSTSKITNVVLGVVFAIIITEFSLGIFARDVRYLDSVAGSVLAQPANVQIAFAILLSFGIAGYVVKIFLDVNYLWILISAVILLFLGYTNYTRGEEMAHITRTWSAVFFPAAVDSIIPLQMMSFSALGSAGGYWLAVRYKIWKNKQEE